MKGKVQQQMICNKKLKHSMGRARSIVVAVQTSCLALRRLLETKNKCEMQETNAAEETAKNKKAKQPSFFDDLRLLYKEQYL